MVYSLSSCSSSTYTLAYYSVLDINKRWCTPCPRIVILLILLLVIRYLILINHGVLPEHALDS